MSNVGRRYRSFGTIGPHDLRRLARIARDDRRDFFKSHPKWARAYGKRFLCAALCQGAAQHYIDNTTGINDFDVYSFYSRNPRKQWYAKRIKAHDFHDAKFGKSKDKPDFVGRRVDCMGRTIDVRKNEDILKSLQRYLMQGRTKTARLLALKAVILLEPSCGKVVWPPEKGLRK